MTYTLESIKKPTPEMLGKGVKFERIRRITGYLVGSVERLRNR